MKLTKLLNEININYGTNNWKKDFQQGKVYENPFHKAFKAQDGTNESSTLTNETGNKMLTEKVIKKLKEKKVHSESRERRQKLQELIDKLEEDSRNGNYLDEIKSLYEVIKETYFKRKDMPQVKTDDLGKAIKQIRDSGIKITKGTATPDRFEPSQKDIYKDKVQAILKRTSKSNLRNMKPLIISKDNYIVDGHHRWKALMVGFPADKIPYIKIDLPIKRAVQMYNHIADKI